ncbi:2193_t:CDS:2 [Funneliformis geosporum]|uniref:2193_t:CDS:1 n=1 Tax=Funneliformis geosporum TaxID=1117311 RepID=A0A9W4SSS0_9GLOM|nr:2193_t:CDS:2 [Funneliformis geosporum]
MGILARRRNHKSPTEKSKLRGAGEGGYIAEFITQVLKHLLPDLVKYNIKVITNAGGLDPLACKQAIENAINESGIEDGQLIVAAITGDDILNYNEEFKQKGDVYEFTHIIGNDQDSDNFPSEEKEVISLNAYLGAIPIAMALDSGANIVVTGRCVDSALVVGPLINEFKWDPHKDWDKLASGSLAGHIIECGCQATGGNFTDWEKSAFSEHGGWTNMGYPIVECFENGDFYITKPKETGGLVTTATVGEQMLYEILDPGSYILPDVVLDIRNVKLKQIERNKVLVTGAKGRPPTEYLKVSGIYLDGYKMTGSLLIGGIDALKKASVVGLSIITKTNIMLNQLGLGAFRNVNVEPLGAEHTYGPHTRTQDTREVVLNLTAATCMAPGITGGGSGRPNPSPCLVHFSCLVPKGVVFAYLKAGNDAVVKTIQFEGPINNDSIIPPLLFKNFDNEVNEMKTIESNVNVSGGTIKVPLIRLAWGRSGDKGDTCNIGIIAREQKYYPLLKKILTEEEVKYFMTHLCKGIVKRYELPGCNGLNFVLTKCLDKGKHTLKCCLVMK